MLQQKLSKLNNFRLDLDTARRNHNRSDLQRVRQQQKHDNVEPTLMGKLQEQATELDGERTAEEICRFLRRSKCKAILILLSSGDVCARTARGLPALSSAVSIPTL